MTVRVGLSRFRFHGWWTGVHLDTATVVASAVPSRWARCTKLAGDSQHYNAHPFSDGGLLVVAALCERRNPAQRRSVKHRYNYVVSSFSENRRCNVREETPRILAAFSFTPPHCFNVS